MEKYFKLYLFNDLLCFKRKHIEKRSVLCIPYNVLLHWQCTDYVTYLLFILRYVSRRIIILKHFDFNTLRLHPKI